MLVYFVYVVGTCITGTNAGHDIFGIHDIRKALDRLLASSKLENMTDMTTNFTELEPIIKLHSIALENNAINQEIDKKNNMKELNLRKRFYGKKPRHKKHREKSQYDNVLPMKAQGETEINQKEISKRDRKVKETNNDINQFEMNFNETRMKVKKDLQNIMKNLTRLRAKDLSFNYRNFKPLERKKTTKYKYTNVSAKVAYVSKKVTNKVKNTATTTRLHYNMGKKRPLNFFNFQKIADEIKKNEGENNVKQQNIYYKSNNRKKKNKETTEAQYEEGIISKESGGRKANEDKEILGSKISVGISQHTKNIKQEQPEEKNTGSTYIHLVTHIDLKKETTEATNLGYVAEEAPKTATQIKVRARKNITEVVANLHGSNATPGVQNDIDKVLNSLLASSKLLEITESIANKVIEQVVKLRNKLFSEKTINNEINKKIDLVKTLKRMDERNNHKHKKETGYTQIKQEGNEGQAIAETIDNNEKVAINENETHRIVQINLQDIMKNLTELRAQNLSFNYINYKGTDKKNQPLHIPTTVFGGMRFDSGQIAKELENIAESEIERLSGTNHSITYSMFQNLTDNTANREDKPEVNKQNVPYRNDKGIEEVENKVEEINAEIEEEISSKITRFKYEDEGENGIAENSNEKKGKTTESHSYRIVTYDEITEENMKEYVIPV